MKRFAIFLSIILVMFSFSMLEGKQYTGYKLEGTDTLLATAVDTITTSIHNSFSDSLEWVFGIVADQTEDSVGLKIDAYWSFDNVLWTNAQAVTADHTVSDNVVTTYVPEHISKFYRYCMVIVTGTANNDQTEATIFKTYLIWRVKGR